MRLELTSRTDLALRAIRLLARDGGRAKRATLAQQLETSPDFLARILGPLVHRGWLVSGTGPAGGYELADPVRSVSVLQLIAAVEGVPDEDRCVLRAGPCDSANRCALHDAWTRARKALTAELDGSFVID
jgi:Rrf2 family protein